MRYGKKISAILAAAMVFSSVSSYAVMAEAPDIDEMVDIIASAETEGLETEAIDISEDSATLAATNVTVTVEQVENGTIEIFNESLASEVTVDISKAAEANEVIDANDHFMLTAPDQLGGAGTDKAGVFADNPAITTTYMEFRKSSSTNFKFIVEPMENGILTVYARSGPTKPIGLACVTDDGSVQKKYLGTDTESESGSTEKYLYDKVTFEVEAGKKYELYADGSTGRLFGVKFVGKNEASSTETLSVKSGDKVKVVATPNKGYENGKILINGEEKSSNGEYVFKADADTTVSATFEKDPVIAAAEKEFNDLTLPSEITDNLTLPTELADGLVTISWESSNPSAIGTDGTVNRAVGKDIPVTLTATATLNGNETITRTFNLTVKSLDYAEELEKAVFEIPETITEDFKLPATFLGEKLVWSVDQTRYITFGSEVDKDGNITATVKKPYFVEGDKAVVLTATVEGTNISRTFNATVQKSENSADASTAKFISERIEIKVDDVDETESGKLVVTKDIELPTTDATYGGTITWVSSNPKVVSNKGVVIRPSGSDVTVRLTAIVEQDGVKATREFTVTVKGKKSNTSGGGGGGGGSFVPSGGGAGGVVGSYADYNDIVSNPNINTNVSAPKFTDLQEHGWAVAHINRLVNKGIVKGVGDDKFDPNALVTREQFATMLVRAFGFEKNTDNAKTFEDVENGSYYEEAVAILSSMGVVKGQSDTVFGVGQGITRQDLAVMAALATNIDSDNETGEFSDAAEISDYAFDSVVKMKKCGVLSGDENNNFNPKAYATRAEAAKILSVIMDYMEQSATK